MKINTFLSTMISLISTFFNWSPIRIFFKILNPMTYINFFKNNNEIKDTSNHKTMVDSSTSTSDITSDSMSLDMSMASHMDLPMSLSNNPMYHSNLQNSYLLHAEETTGNTLSPILQTPNQSATFTNVEIQTSFADMDLSMRWVNEFETTTNLTLANVPPNMPFTMTYTPRTLYENSSLGDMITNEFSAMIPMNPDNYTIYFPEGQVVISENTAHLTSTSSNSLSQMVIENMTPVATSSSNTLSQVTSQPSVPEMMTQQQSNLILESLQNSNSQNETNMNFNPLIQNENLLTNETPPPFWEQAQNMVDLAQRIFNTLPSNEPQLEALANGENIQSTPESQIMMSSESTSQLNQMSTPLLSNMETNLPIEAIMMDAPLQSAIETTQTILMLML